MGAQNARKFLLHTGYPLDKIIYLKPQTIVVPANSNVDTDIPHGLGFTPLVKGRWSRDSNFSISYNISGGPYLSAGLLLAATVISADEVKVYLSTTNNTNASITIYYHIWGFVPSNALDSVVNTHTASSADSFVLNTDYNYTKLLDRGVISATTGTHAYPVYHSLGYYPQIEAWIDIGGRVSPIVFNNITTHIAEFDTIRTTIDDEKLLFEVIDVLTAFNFHYRIYVDEV